jgi:hypothetical protein
MRLALFDREHANGHGERERPVVADGPDNIVTITGPAGTGFAEDTLCIHKGQSPTARERLILQFQYAFNDWGIQHDDRDPAEFRMI